jgi:hypothetical protein
MDRTLEPKKSTFGVLLALPHVVQDGLNKTALLFPLFGALVRTLQDDGSASGENLADLAATALGRTRDDHDIIAAANMDTLFLLIAHTNSSDDFRSQRDDLHELLLA